jgi:hypothetical protein
LRLAEVSKLLLAGNGLLDGLRRLCLRFGQRVQVGYRPQDVARRGLFVSVVWALWCEGYRWPKQEDLLHKVNERLGHNEWASLPTLKIALAYLRKEGFIDL